MWHKTATGDLFFFQGAQELTCAATRLGLGSASRGRKRAVVSIDLCSVESTIRLRFLAFIIYFTHWLCLLLKYCHGIREHLSLPRWAIEAARLCSSCTKPPFRGNVLKFQSLSIVTFILKKKRDRMETVCVRL